MASRAEWEAAMAVPRPLFASYLKTILLFLLFYIFLCVRLQPRLLSAENVEFVPKCTRRTNQRPRQEKAPFLSMLMGGGDAGSSVSAGGTSKAIGSRRSPSRRRCRVCGKGKSHARTCWHRYDKKKTDNGTNVEESGKPSEITGQVIQGKAGKILENKVLDQVVDNKTMEEVPPKKELEKEVEKVAQNDTMVKDQAINETAVKTDESEDNFGKGMGADALKSLSEDQLASYLLNRPRGPSVLMPHLPKRPKNPHLFGGVQNIDDDQAYIEYWAELRITRETIPKGINVWVLSWLPNSQYSQTEYFRVTHNTRFVSKPQVFDTTLSLAQRWYLDALDPFITFRSLKQLWLRLDDLRESAHRISENSPVDFRVVVDEALKASSWRVELEPLFSILNEIMFQTWRGYIHAQRAPKIFTNAYQRILESPRVHSEAGQEGVVRTT